MALIDSAGIRLNPASEIIVEANKEGEVISARNEVNGIEYVGGGSGDIVLSDLHIINNSNSDIQLNGAMCKYSEYDDPQYTSGYNYLIYPNSEEHVNIVVYHGYASVRIEALSGATITTSGNITAGYGNYYEMTGDAEVTAV